ncbi:MAG TPA: hypothetical protein VGC76_14940 [Pyrinomonadaceae bacterium]|jgi:ElaB/YqjD/DUF883 family membrane-anchored ribosome-binding protein
MAETEATNEHGLIKTDIYNGEDKETDYMNEFKAQAGEYGQKLQDAAVKAKDFATETFAQASDKFKELSNKDPKELVEEAKEYARQKPGQTILISAAVGLVIGFLIKGRR